MISVLKGMGIVRNLMKHDRKGPRVVGGAWWGGKRPKEVIWPLEEGMFMWHQKDKDKLRARH